jgi:hypothetical protein
MSESFPPICFIFKKLSFNTCMYQPPECINLVVDKNMCFRKDIDIENTLKLVCLEHGRRNFKDTIPLLSSLPVIFFGVVKHFCRFWIWSETECKTPAEYGLEHNSTPPHPSPHSHTLSVYTEPVFVNV